jgi:hypothetical protein
LSGFAAQGILRKRFFFEKKNQKTFALGRWRVSLLAPITRGAGGSRVFASFFKKKRFLAAWLDVV